jgi:anti-sigma factor RsiW
MTCRELTEFLNDYVSADLPGAQRRVFEEHLSICEDCRVYLASYEATIELAKSALDEGPVPEAVPEALVQAVVAARKAR